VRKVGNLHGKLVSGPFRILKGGKFRLTSENLIESGVTRSRGSQWGMEKRGLPEKIAATKEKIWVGAEQVISGLPKKGTKTDDGSPEEGKTTSFCDLRD